MEINALSHIFVKLTVTPRYQFSSKFYQIYQFHDFMLIKQPGDLSQRQKPMHPGISVWKTLFSQLKPFFQDTKLKYEIV